MWRSPPTTLVSDGNGGFTTKAVYTARTGSGVRYDAIDDERNGANNRIVNLGEDLYDGDLVLRGGDEAFGRPSVEWTYKSRSVGTYALDDNLLETYTAKVSRGTMYSLVGSTVINKLKDGESDLYVYVDGVGQQIPAAQVDSYFDRNNSTGIGSDITGNGILTEVYTNGDDDIFIVVVNTYLVKATADYNTNKEELTIETIEVDEADDPTPALPASIDNDDLRVEDFKEGDYLLVTVSLKDSTPSIESVELAEVLTGEVSEYTETENVFIGGNEYKYNKLVGSDESKVAYTTGEEARVVLDAYGYILYVDEAVSTSSYVYIQESDSAVGVGSKTAANAFFTDGTNDAIILKKVGGNTDTNSLQTAGGWYTYIKDSADRYSLANVIAPQTTTNGAAVNTTGGAMASYAAANATVMTNSQVKFLAGESVKANANTVFILWNAKNETYVYEGIENAPTVKTGTSTDDGDTNTVLVNYIQKNGYATYVFIDTSRDADAQIDDVNNVADYLFILKPTNNKTVVGEETYYQYKVLFDGEETTKYIEQDIVGSDAQGIMVYNVKANDKDYITSATLFEDHDPSQGGTKDIHEVTEMDIADGDTLTQSGKTISITGDLLGTSTAANREYIVDNDTVLNLIVGKGCALLKDAGANYELYQNLSASGLAGLVKGYALDGTVFAVTDDGNSDVLDYLYVYVEQAKETEANVAEIDTISINGTKVTGYKDIEDAVDAPVAIVDISSSVGVAATGTGTLSAHVAKGYTTGTPIYASRDIINDDYTASGSAGIDLIKIEAESTDGSSTETLYVAVKVEELYTIKVNNTFTASVRASIDGGESVTVDNGETKQVLGNANGEDSYVLTLKISGADKDVDVTIDGGSANIWDNGDGTYEISDITNDVTVKIADKAGA